MRRQEKKILPRFKSNNKILIKIKIEKKHANFEPFRCISRHSKFISWKKFAWKIQFRIRFAVNNIFLYANSLLHGLWTQIPSSNKFANNTLTKIHARSHSTKSALLLFFQKITIVGYSISYWCMKFVIYSLTMRAFKLVKKKLKILKRQADKHRIDTTKKKPTPFARSTHFQLNQSWMLNV